jgi:hypothetical protein
MKTTRRLALAAIAILVIALTIKYLPLLPWPEEWRHQWSPEVVGIWIGSIGTVSAFTATLFALVWPMRQERQSAKSLAGLACINLTGSLWRRVRAIDQAQISVVTVECALFKEALRLAKTVPIELLAPRIALKFARTIGEAIYIESQLENQPAARDQFKHMVCTISNLVERLDVETISGGYAVFIKNVERNGKETDGGPWSWEHKH